MKCYAKRRCESSREGGKEHKDIKTGKNMEDRKTDKQ
jgi:hypothetical protein